MFGYAVNALYKQDFLFKFQIKSPLLFQETERLHFLYCETCARPKELKLKVLLKKNCNLKLTSAQDIHPLTTGY